MLHKTVYSGAIGLFTFIAIALAITGVVFLIIAVAKRCRACGNLGHAFSSTPSADLASGKAFITCKKCGNKVHRGNLTANNDSKDASVIWFDGSSGKFKEDGSYQSDSSGADGGDAGGGGD